MNLAGLRTFLTIVETGSLVRAAGQLNVTQSTVTARLKTLEDELGQQLINRQKSGASMTAAGQRLHLTAQTISDLWTKARAETALPDTLGAVCNMVCHPDLWAGLGEVLFDQIRVTQPHVALSVWTGSADDMDRWMTSGRADIALSHRPARQPQRHVFDLPTDRLILVTTHPGSPERFDPAYVFVEGGDDFGRDHAAHYADANTARLSFGTAALGLQHILSRGGSAFLPERLCKPGLASGQLHRIDGAPVFERPAFLVANRSAVAGWPWFEAAQAAL